MKKPAAIRLPLATAAGAPAPLATAASPAALPTPGTVALCLLRGPGYVVELFNPVAARLWGQLASRALGRPFLHMLPQVEVARYAAALAAVWQSGQVLEWPELPVVAVGLAGRLAISYFTLSFQLFPYKARKWRASCWWPRT